MTVRIAFREAADACGGIAGSFGNEIHGHDVSRQRDLRPAKDPCFLLEKIWSKKEPLSRARLG